ncbi:MAG: hypothetical protein PHN49_07900, partial [Candidatus Omnitrophica bacterium]|nr:hypothetical protein [Candidatus Omnitrophota bacterium]
PDGTDLGEPISDKKDTREVYDVRTDYTFRSKDRSKSLKAGYGLRFSKENDLGEFDYLSNIFSLQPSIAFKRVLVSFPVYYTHDVVNSKNYLSAVTAGNVNNIMVTQNNMAQVGVTYQFNDYLRPPYGDENRSGNDIAETLGWFWFFNERKAFTTLRYTADQNLAHGDNWVYTGQRLDAGFMVPFWKRFEYSLNGQFYAKDFAHKHTVLNKKRHDQVYSLSSFLSYEFYKNMELQFQYTYINTRSTLSLYQYSRQILSGGVQYSF